MNLAEKEKYQKAWDHDAYRVYSPGEKLVVPFMMIARPKVGSTIRDYGAGTGRASLFLHDLGYEVNMVDIADNCLDAEVSEKIGDRLHLCDLSSRVLLPPTDYGYCVDVVEHIPTQDVDTVLENIFTHSRKVFFQICLQDDHFGEELGEDLHLTVKPYTWWRDKLKEHCSELIEARDLIYNAVYYACA